MLFLLPIFCGLVGVGLFSAYVFRKPLVHWGIVAYLKSKNIAIDFNLKKLSWAEILVTDINIENGILIPKIHILRSSSSPQIAHIQSIVIDVTSIDVWTTKKVMEQLAISTSDESTPLPQFTDIKNYCDRLVPTNVQVSIKTLIHENTAIPLNMELEHKPQSNVTQFSFAGEKLNFTNNKKFKLKTDTYSGKMELVCEPELVTIVGDPIHLSIASLAMTEPFFEMKNSKLFSEKMWVAIDSKNKAILHFPLQFQVSARTATQKIHAKLPHFLISGTYYVDASQKSSVQGSAKNFSASAPYAIDVQKITADLTTPYGWASAIDGDIDVSGITYKDEKLKPLIQNVDMHIHFQKAPASVSATVNVTDKTKNLSLKNIQIMQTGSAISADFDKTTTKVNLNSQITDLIPMAKEYIKTLSGTLTFDGLVNFKNNKLAGHVHINGKDINANSEFGTVMGLNVEHDVVSFDTFASSPHRKLTIKKFTVGKDFDNVTLDYQVVNTSHIATNKLHLEHEGAHLDTGQFFINPLKKELNGFKATVKELKLSTVLAMAVGPFITAEGTLSGNLDLELQDKIPTVSGQLKSDKPGWIHYRKQGEKQQAAIQLTDSPMTILNSYLYNFHYEDLDLEIHTNREYEMNVLLAAFGHNPDYLEGKPLKLKINLEQNVLGAIQSMMLSYDLPSKIKEKLEKAGN